jgi:hypothetical protein
MVSAGSRERPGRQRSDDMPDLEQAFGQLRKTSRAAMLRRRLAKPGSEAWRQADELVHEVATVMAQVAALMERRQGRSLQPVRVRNR